MAQHLSRLVLWAVGGKEDNKQADGDAGSGKAGSGGAADEAAKAEGLLHAAAHELQAAAEGEDGAQGPRLLERLGSAGFQVGGRVSGGRVG